jgi:hypothetical protein
MTQKKKKVRIMRNKEKILKQNSLSSRIYIRIGLVLVGVVVAVGLIAAFGTSFSNFVAVWLGYKLLRLIFKVIGLALSLVFTLISIGILIAIISLLII